MASTLRGITSYFHSRQAYTHFFDKGGNLYTNGLDSSDFRNVMTTVFVLLNFSIVFLGSSFLKARNLQRLRTRSKPVPMNYFTSWMSLTGTLAYLRQTCKLPGGFYGSLMFLTGVFGLVHQYFVNSYILPVSMQRSCPFEVGVVTTHMSRGTAIIPLSTNSAVSTVYNAQYQVFVNNGRIGIYDKVNYNLPNIFSPTADEVLGKWKCTEQDDTNMTWTDWQTYASVTSFLWNQQFLFTEVNAGWVESVTLNDGVSFPGGFLLWTADQPNNSSQQWKVRASVGTNLPGPAGPVNSTVPVTSLECQLHLANEGWTPPVMPSDDSLHEWVARTYGFLMTDRPELFGSDIEWMLNAMVMVAGSGNIDGFGSSALPAGASTTYGCILHFTKISPQIWAILGAMVLLLVPLVPAYIFLCLAQLFQRKHIDCADLAEAGPSSVQEWQLFVLKELTQDKTITARQMRDYSYGWDIAKKKYILDRNTVFQRIPVSAASIN